MLVPLFPTRVDWIGIRDRERGKFPATQPASRAVELDCTQYFTAAAAAETDIATQ